MRVRDIGQAIDGPQNRKVAAWQNNKPAVLLLVFKQPGANVIEHGRRRARPSCPQLLKSIPPDIKVEVVSDRTQTIRASVKDVEIHAAAARSRLVVAVIFVFLRSAWATDHPEHHHPRRPRRHARR